MSLSRLPLTLRSTSLLRSLSTTASLQLPERPAQQTTSREPTSVDPLPASRPDPAPRNQIAPADIVSGARSGPITERLSSDEVSAETISGAPSKSIPLSCSNGSISLTTVVDALLHRQVRIYQPTKSTMQSAKGKTKRWIVDWDVLSGAGRWENPLMGWASSADYMQGTQMFFRTREAATAFVRPLL